MTQATLPRSIVLYADDDLDDLELINEVFSKHARNVDLITVADGLEVLSFLKNLKTDTSYPCLIILDINMPRMTGKEALIQIRGMERFKDVPVILFTTSNQPIDQSFAKEYNAGFLTKPIEYSQFDKIANTFIDYCADEIQKHIRKRGNS